MSELYINLIVVLVLFTSMNFIRAKFAGRISLNIQRAIYIAAIAYFLFVIIYYSNSIADHTKRMLQIILFAGIIGYLIYKIFLPGKKAV